MLSKHIAISTKSLDNQCLTVYIFGINVKIGIYILYYGFKELFLQVRIFLIYIDYENSFDRLRKNGTHDRGNSPSAWS